MRKFTFKSLLIAAALCLGTSAWAQETTVLYERGTTIAWSEDDLAEGAWNVSISDRSYPCSPVINETLGLSLPGQVRNQEIMNSTQIVPTANSILTIDAVWNVGGTTGKNGNKTYFKIGNQIEFFAMPQEQTGGVIVNGKTYNFSNACNKNNDNRIEDVWTINVVINTATNVITALNVSGQNGKTKVSEALADLSLGSDAIFNTLSLGCVRMANSMYTSLKSIKISECKQTLNEANYTIKYLCGDIVVKEPATRTGVVNNNILLPQSDKEVIWKDGVKYIYVSDDSSDKTITEDGSTVVTVTYREAATYSYTIKSNLGSTIASGSNFEGETITYGYPQYQVSDGTLYSTSKNVNEWRKTFELTEDNQEVTVNYDATSITDVVFHIENENIEGVNVLTANNANIRCSNAAAAWSSSDVVLTTLDKGTYKLVAQVFSPQSSGGNQTFKVGGVTINFITGNSNTTVCESEFMVTDNKDLVWSAGGGNRNGIDFVYVVKLSDELSPVTTTITAAGYATFSSTYAVDFSKAAGLAAYTAKVNDGNQTITLTKIADGIVPANTGVVLKGAAGEYTGTITTTEAVIENNDLVAATEEIPSLATETTVDEVTYKNYILNVVDETPGFYQANDKKVAAGKAYLQVLAETVAEAKTLTIVWNDGETTGIEENYEFGTMNSDAATFDLSGRKVANPAKGLYIKNGKKFIVK